MNDGKYMEANSALRNTMEDYVIQAREQGMNDEHIITSIMDMLYDHGVKEEI